MPWRARRTEFGRSRRRFLFSGLHGPGTSRGLAASSPRQGVSSPCRTMVQRPRDWQNHLCTTSQAHAACRWKPGSVPMPPRPSTRSARRSPHRGSLVDAAASSHRSPRSCSHSWAARMPQRKRMPLPPQPPHMALDNGYDHEGRVRSSMCASALSLRLSHMPINFCSYSMATLLTRMWATIKATSVAIPTTPTDAQPRGTQHVVLIDNVHCNIGPRPR